MRAKIGLDPRLTLPGYEILRKIGSGGMGEVYLARQQSLARLVAIKVLRIEGSLNQAEEQARFEREALLMAEVSHPNILAVFDRGMAQGRPYLVTEYVPGGNLRDLIIPGRPVPLEQARPLLRSVGQAVEHLHQCGILHRDLKPENVLLDEHGQTHLSDFGIAMPLAETALLAHDTESVGTVDYIAPEQRHRLAVDDRADQYALSVIAYELLTGEKPRKVLRKPSQHNACLTPVVDDVIQRGLKRDPDERYASTGEFVEALDVALAQVLASHGKRHWQQALTAAIGLALLAAFVVGAILLSPAESERARSGFGSLVAPGSERLSPTATSLLPSQQHWARYFNTEPAIVNSLGMKMVLVPPGTFLMGSPQEEIERLRERRAARKLKHARQQIWLERLSSEGPQHQVTIDKPYYLGATEVTVGQFRAFVAATGHVTEAEKQGPAASRPHKSNKFSRKSLSSADPTTAHTDDTCPITDVSYNDATAFCHWLSEKEAMEYRLPTEAEWEYACRAGSTDTWCFGNLVGTLAEYSWYTGNAGTQPHPVATKKANAFGLFDMHGNVREWCADWYQVDYYRSAPAQAPAGPSTGRFRVIRDGAFDEVAPRMRASSRSWQRPSYFQHNCGFRIALAVPL